MSNYPGMNASVKTNVGSDRGYKAVPGPPVQPELKEVPDVLDILESECKELNMGLSRLIEETQKVRRQVPDAPPPMETRSRNTDLGAVLQTRIDDIRVAREKVRIMLDTLEL